MESGTHTPEPEHTTRSANTARRQLSLPTGMEGRPLNQAAPAQGTVCPRHPQWPRMTLPGWPTCEDSASVNRVDQQLSMKSRPTRAESQEPLLADLLINTSESQLNRGLLGKRREQGARRWALASGAATDSSGGDTG